MDKAEVDWERIIHNACDRQPPFCANEHEKGFRDAMIAESFFQFVKNSLQLKSKCKLVFITDDTELQTHVKNETQEMPGVEILSGISELKELIRILTSPATDEVTIKNYKISAEKLFHDEESELYSKIYNEIIKLHKHNLSLYVELEDFSHEADSFCIHPPKFLKIEKRNIYWNSRIEIERKIYDKDFENNGLYLFSQNRAEEFKSIFDINWHAEIDKNGNLINTQIDATIDATPIGEWMNKSLGMRLNYIGSKSFMTF